MHIKALAIDRRMVKLKVARLNNDASRCVQGNRKAIGKRVCIADKLGQEIFANADDIAGLHGAQLRTV